MNNKKTMMNEDKNHHINNNNNNNNDDDYNNINSYNPREEFMRNINNDGFNISQISQRSDDSDTYSREYTING
jgi:hypothetical protein